MDARLQGADGTAGVGYDDFFRPGDGGSTCAASFRYSRGFDEPFSRLASGLALPPDWRCRSCPCSSLGAVAGAVVRAARPAAQPAGRAARRRCSSSAARSPRGGGDSGSATDARPDLNATASAKPGDKRHDAQAGRGPRQCARHRRRRDADRGPPARGPVLQDRRHGCSSSRLRPPQAARVSCRRARRPARQPVLVPEPHDDKRTEPLDVLEKP